MFDLLKKRTLLAKREMELKQYENQIRSMLKECEETIEEAKRYLNLCGFSEEDIQKMFIKSKLKVIYGKK